MGSKSKKSGAKKRKGSTSTRREGPAEGMLSRERQLRPRNSFEDVVIGEGDGGRVIGRRVRVFWPLDNKWYSGVVKALDVKKKRHHVVYDDGDEEWLHLPKERLQVLLAPGELLGQRAPPAPATKRKRLSPLRLAKEEDQEPNDKADSHDEVEGHVSKKVKSSRRTAPRSKRGASARRTPVKPIAEDTHVTHNRVGRSQAQPDINVDQAHANVEDITVPEIESIANDADDEKKQPKGKESGLLCEKKADSSVTETDIVGDMDAKDVTKQAEKLDESATDAEQMEEQQKDEVVRQGNEDEPTRDQSSEKHLDVTLGDEKATGKPGDVKDADQLNKKHNKKHRGKVKPRDPVKK